MIFLVIKFVAAITPSVFLPNGTRIVADQYGGRQVVLNVHDRRELYKRNLTYYINRFLDRYSPARRSILFYKKQRLKRKQDQFYCLMGKIALTHAGIEQCLKNTLMEDWGVSKKFSYYGKTQNIEHIHGRSLRKIFIKLMGDLMIPGAFLNEYEGMCDRFWKLSERRNKALKAAYTFNLDTAEVSQVHEKNHDIYDRPLTHEEMINLWMPKVDLDDLDGLLKELDILGDEFMKIRGGIFRDKIRLTSELCSEVGKTYPHYAFKNPYRYKASLKI